MKYRIIALSIAGLIPLTSSFIQAAEVDTTAANRLDAKKQDETTLRAAKKKHTPANRETSGSSETVTAPAVRSAVLPKIPASELASAPIATANGLFVNKIVLENQTIIPFGELAAMLAPYEKRPVSADELQDLRHRLSQYYLEKGYVNSGVVLPDQKIVDGVVVLRAVEGNLNKIEIVGSEKLTSEYIEEQIRLGAKNPLNVADLRQSLRAFEQNPSIEDIDAQLLPMANYGESLLKVRIKERRPYSLGIVANNYRSAAIGEEQLRLQAAYRNGLRSGDEVSGEIGVTQGANEYLLRYSVPVPVRQIKFDVYAAQTSAAVVKSGYENIDIRSNSTARGFGFTAPLIMNKDDEVSVSARFDAKTSETFIGDLAVAFSAGPDDGKNRDSVFSGTVNWNHNWGRQILGLSGGVKLGVDMLDATITDSSADGRFGTVVAQSRYLRQIGGRNGYLSARLSVQYSPSSLLAMEKMALGGVNSIRGYQENQWLGDNGTNFVLEWHYPYSASMGARTGIKLDVIPFIDYGSVWDNEASSTAKHLSSIGAAVKAQLLKNLSTELSWGYIVNRADEYESPYKGINLGLLYRYPG